MRRPGVVTRRSESGQALLISLGILVILFISIPVIWFVTREGISHQTSSQKQSEGRAVAAEGIAYAAQYFAANQVEWAKAVKSGNGNFTNVFAGSGCNTNAVVPGTQFKLTCSGRSATYPQLQPYQVIVIATAWLPQANGQTGPSSSLQAILSQKTLGASLANGVRASAALELMVNTDPAANTLLTVHWGPIVSYDRNQWRLYASLDVNPTYPTLQGFPRKFCNGGIKGTALDGTGAIMFPRSPDLLTSAVTSDQLEYWAFASLSPPQTINDSSYTLTAAGETGLLIPDVPLISYGSNNGVPLVCTAGPTAGNQNSGIYNVPTGCAAYFDEHFSVTDNSAVIYVNGNAVFHNLKLDLKNGAFIVTGILDLQFHDTNHSGQALTLNIPATAPLEYPYWPASGGTPWPCKAQLIPNTLSHCDSTVASPGNPNVDFRGFLWVKTALIVESMNWVMAGAMRVGDPSIANPGSNILGAGSLTLFYDAGVNQSIVTVAY